MSTTQAVWDGSLLIAVPVSVAAGLVSFASPCVLPLVPGYLGYVTGLTGIDLEEQRRWRMVTGIGLFVLGFSAVFVTIGWAAGAVGAALQAHSLALTRIMGVMTIGMGLLYLGVMPRLRGGLRLDVRPVAGLAGAPLLGAVFGLSWTACTGPTLAAIAAMSGIGGNPARGALLASAYCLGLGIPFLLAGLGYRRAMGAFAVIRRHQGALTRFGGAMLLAVGVLLVTGIWSTLMARLAGSITSFVPVI
jgi:cytochrome c-type biogenesis protein